MRARRVIVFAGCVAAAASTGQALGADTPPTRFVLPVGVLRLSASELPAASSARVTFSVRLARRVRAGKLALSLPRLWTQRSPVSGLAYAKLPKRGRASNRRARTSRAARVVSFSFMAARKGDSASFDVRDNGIPAATYRLPFSWREGGRVRARGTARVLLYARPRPR